MIWDLIATIVCGLGAAGIALGIRALSGNRMPRWLIPVFAGLGMMGYQIHIEYIWFDHKASMLPDEAVVVSTEKNSAPWRPWSYVYPQVTAFTVLDTSSIRQDRANANIMQFYMYRFEKLISDPVTDQVYLLNCDSNELLPLDESRDPVVKSLRRLPASNPIVEEVCQ